MVTFHPKRHSGKLWKIISKSLHFLSYVGLYLFGKKLKEIILNAHQNNINKIKTTYRQ